MHTKIKHFFSNKDLVLTGVIALIIGTGLGYSLHGVLAASTSALPPGMGNGFTARTGQGTLGANRSGSLLTGTVVSKDASSITLNTRDGNSHIVLITPATSISKSVDGTLDDVTTDSTVIVSGTSGTNGSVTASLIQLRPADSFGPPEGR